MKPTQIKTARKALGWTQKDLAANADVHHKTVAYCESRTGSGAASKGVKGIMAAFDQAGIGKALTDPRAAMLEAFEEMTPEQQVEAALTICGQAHSLTPNR